MIYRSRMIVPDDAPCIVDLYSLAHVAAVISEYRARSPLKGGATSLPVG